jgi:hypothetical protein
MKKGIIVLLIAVLVAGFAFAGTFTGSASINFGVDLDKKTFGFTNATAWEYSFKFEFDSTKISIGEDHQTDLWAEIAAEASATASISKKDDAKGSFSGAYAVKISKANIHVGEWTFGILSAGSAVDYAKTYETNDDGDAINDVVAGESKAVPGFTVAYKDWRGGFGLKGNWAGESLVYNVFAHGETKEFKFGENEEFKLQAGAYVHYYNEVLTGAYPKNVGGAAKVGYEKDAFSADAAVDLQMVLASEKEFKFEADANATYKFSDKGSVGLNVYGTNFIYLAMGEKDPIAVDTYEKYEATSYKGIKLDAKLWAKYDFDFDGTTLATEAHVEVKDALVDGREIVVFAKETLKVLDGKLALVFSEKYEFAESTLTVTAKATYTAEDEKFVAWVGVDSFAFSFADKAVSVLKISCGIKSAKIIENAEIGLTYGTLNLFGEKSNGTIKAYAKIAF